MKHLPRSPFVGHRAAPFGSVEAMVSYTASTRRAQACGGIALAEAVVARSIERISHRDYLHVV
jgi:hypothetical protein